MTPHPQQKQFIRICESFVGFLPTRGGAASGRGSQSGGAATKSLLGFDVILTPDWRWFVARNRKWVVVVIGDAGTFR
jgi:hypothetical protein